MIMSEWIALRDDDGTIVARYNRLHRILVIKRRQSETRFHLGLYDMPLDNPEHACYDDRNRIIAAQPAPS